MYVGNDIVAGEKDKTPDQVLELYKYIVKRIRTKHARIPITWLAISPSEKRWAVWDKVQQANALIKNYSQSEPDMYFIDAGNNFLGEDGKPISKYYKDDKLHYNEMGYNIWGNAIKKEVKEIAEY